MRLRAAQALGAEGHPVLVDIAENGADDECGAKAVTSLGESLSACRAVTILERASESRRVATARACIARLAQVKDPIGVSSLVRLVATDDRLGSDAARALGTIGATAAEEPLIAALTPPLLDLRLAATEALGRVGSIAAVLPLKEAAERDMRLRSSVRQSVAEIQARLTGASPGQLSMSDGDAGRLSLTSDSAGRLSLEAQTGRVSVDGESDKS